MSAPDANALRAHFFEHWRGAARDPRPEIGEALGQLHKDARAAWPSVDVDVLDFVAYLAARAPASDGPTEALALLCASDLYLACACARGQPEALTELERRYISRVPSYLGRLTIRVELIAEVKQALRERLLVGVAGASPTIVDYDGRGALDSWLRVSATRIALNLLRSEKRRGAAEKGAANVPRPAADPELDFVKSRYRGDFEDAFKAGLGHLGQRERTLLRLHFLDGVGIGQMAVLYGVHRTTLARWLGDAQHAVLEETRRRLAEQLGLDTHECLSLIHHVRSHFATTLHSVLGDDAPE